MAHRARPGQSPRSPLGDMRGQLIQFQERKAGPTLPEA